MDIKVGDKFFMFDTNRRVYERDEKGHATGGPTFRGHFYEVTIDGETSRSWLVGKWKPTKVPKSDPFSVLYTEAMIDDAEWVSRHRSRIASLVQFTKDPDTLRNIAEIVGYSTGKDS